MNLCALYVFQLFTGWIWAQNSAFSHYLSSRSHDCSTIGPFIDSLIPMCSCCSSTLFHLFVSMTGTPQQNWSSASRPLRRSFGKISGSHSIEWPLSVLKNLMGPEIEITRETYEKWRGPFLQHSSISTSLKMKSFFSHCLDLTGPLKNVHSFNGFNASSENDVHIVSCFGDSIIWGKNFAPKNWGPRPNFTVFLGPIKILQPQ